VETRKRHMPNVKRRRCTELYSNEGIELRSPEGRKERPCGLDAVGYCNDCARYLCSIHWNANHGSHEVARR
jgi:hypothetical protein